MFGKLGQLSSLLTALPKIKGELDKLKERIGKLSAEGDAGGGMVRVRVNGHFQMIACHLSPELLQNPDRELIEDLIVAANNQACERVRQLVAEESARMAEELGVPPGTQLPGMS